VGQSYTYEWTIINVATGDVISTGNGTIVPATNRGYRDIYHYIRRNVLGWNGTTRNVGRVRQGVIITVNCCPPNPEPSMPRWAIR